MTDVDGLVRTARVVRLPMRVRFRGIIAREAVVFRGPGGWGEFGAFEEYADDEAANWLAAGIEAAEGRLPAPARAAVAVNATVPAVSADRVQSVLAAFPGCTTAKVKVAESGQTLDDDLARVRAVRAHLGPGARIRVDANGGWSVAGARAAIARLLDDGPLDYAEQPCRTVEELIDLRQQLNGSCRIAADESIRRAEDPLRAARLGAADVAVVKVAPLGGVRAVLAVADEVHRLAGMEITVSSALDTAVGISAGLIAAASLPSGNAAGLATGGFFTEDLGSHELRRGEIAVSEVDPSPDRLAAVEVHGERRDWWIDRMQRCATILMHRESD